MGEIRLRKTDIDDIDLLYEWTNEEAVRKNSINTHKIEYQEHKDWFLDRLYREDCDMFIYLIDEMPVGQIRLDYKDGHGWISFSIDYSYRGQGHGKTILQLAEDEVKRSRPDISCLDGVVKRDNIASKKKFEELNYIVLEQYPDKNLMNLILYQKNLK